MKASSRLHPSGAYKGGRAHHEPAAYSFKSIAMLDALKALGPIHRSAHFEYPTPRRAASPLHTLKRRKGGDLRPRPLWRHSHHAGGHADARQTSRAAAACGSHRASLRLPTRRVQRPMSRHTSSVLHRTRCRGWRTLSRPCFAAACGAVGLANVAPRRLPVRRSLRVALVLRAANLRRSRPMPHAAHAEHASTACSLALSEGQKCTALAHLLLRREIAHIIGQSLGMNGPVVQPNAVG
jgi:hypothetical protein